MRLLRWRWRTRRNRYQRAVDLTSDVTLEQRITFSLLLPSAVRLATYSLARRSRPVRTAQIMCRAQLAPGSATVEPVPRHLT
jgi:hypothetical protein